MKSLRSHDPHRQINVPGSGLFRGFLVSRSLLIFSLLLSYPAFAQSSECGVLREFSGDVRLMDSSMSHLSDTQNSASLPCGSWISVGVGWARIRHQNGAELRLGEQTFVQLKDSKELDQVLLYKGEVWAKFGDGVGELRMASAIGRARLTQGKAILISKSDEDETQLVVLEDSATLENRLKPGRKAVVHAGEASSLNFKLSRVIPSEPSALSVASVKPKLVELRLSENDQTNAIQSIIHRKERDLVAEMVDSNGSGASGTSQTPKRSLASVPNPEKEKNYVRHPASEHDKELRQEWVKKLVGGAPVEDSILTPDQNYGRSQKVQVEVNDPEAKQKKALQKDEEIEKKRLIEDLSRIRMD